MRCKDFERLILSLHDEGLDDHTSEKLKHHKAVCPRCAAFEDDLEKVRVSLRCLPFQTPSEEFFEQTRSRCHAVLGRPARAGRKFLRPSIPRWIWAAFSVLLGLTGVLMLPLAGGIDFSQPLTFPKLAVVILALQNLVMLFFSPLLLQRIRFPGEI
jgi:hypothetical protein